ncbi:MAG: PKD domain-containing protein [Chitinophagales bacterium]|nr:PKD domain-containing protein [Chitinophagales bacterium]MDW8419717.1 PKD domain-containing protein [Chitinophagales bacterium]
MVRALLLLTLLPVCVELFAQNVCASNRYISPVFDSVKLTSGIQYGVADPYGLDDHQQLFLDIYEPLNDTLSKRPVIVYAYGGAFLIGTRNQPPIPYYADFFARHGYVFVSIDYRLGFNVTTPGSPERAVYRAVQDLRAAIRHLAHRAHIYRIDTSKIILFGSSAGCFMALHSSFMEYSQAAAYAAPVPLIDPEILGGVDSSGNADFGYRYIEPFAIINQWGAIADTNWIEADERIPVISFHGDQDLAVPYVYGYPFSYPVFPNVYGSLPIHQRLSNLGIKNKLYTLYGYGHEPELLAPHLRDTILLHTRDFLYSLLQPATDFTEAPLLACTQNEMKYSVSARPSSRYCWHLNGNGIITQNTGHTINVIWTDTGQKSVSVQELSYFLAAGELKTTSTHVKSKVTAGFGYQINELQVSLLNFSTGEESLVWYFGNGFSDTAQNPTVYYAQGGSYTITQIADNGVCPDTFQTILTVDSCPVASFTNTILNANSVVFNAQVTNTTVYFWDFGNGYSLSTTSPNILYTYPQPGAYTVTLMVKNSLSCADTFSANILLTTSTYEINNDADVWITDKVLHFHSSAGKELPWRIYYTNGQLVYEGKSQDKNSIPLHHLPSGMYVFTLTGHNNTIIKRFTLE